MRLLLAFLAVLALMASPLTAATAQVACAQGGSSAMAGMDMPGMAGMDPANAAKSGADSCCDHAGQHGKKADTHCAKACAASCSVAIALPGGPYDVALAPMRADVPPPRSVSTHPYQPSGLKRPPKSIA